MKHRWGQAFLYPPNRPGGRHRPENVDHIEHKELSEFRTIGRHRADLRPHSGISVSALEAKFGPRFKVMPDGSLEVRGITFRFPATLAAHGSNAYLSVVPPLARANFPAFWPDERAANDQ